MSTEDRTPELLARWQAGDRRAIGELIERDAGWILDKVRQRRGALLERDAETVDHFHDLVVEALDYAPRFTVANRAQFRALMARMVDNLLIDRARRLERRPRPKPLADREVETGATTPGEVPRGETAGPATRAAGTEELDMLRLGLEFLDPDERALIREHRLHGRTFVEIAADLDLQPNTVRMRFQRALLRLAGVVQRLQRGGVAAMLDGDADG